jgi:hypothetical protein
MDSYVDKEVTIFVKLHLKQSSFQKKGIIWLVMSKEAAYFLYEWGCTYFKPMGCS